MNDLDYLHDCFEGNQKFQKNSTRKAPKVLIVEDDELFGKTLKRYIEKSLLLEVEYFNCPRLCIKSLEDFEQERGQKCEPFCLVTDISFKNESGSDGLLLIDLLRERDLTFVSVVMTGFASIETAISATRRGVYHYLTKPFEPEVLGRLIKDACIEKLNISPEVFNKNSNVQVSDENSYQMASSRSSRLIKIERPKSEDIFCSMIGRSQMMKEVFERVSKVASSDSTVLIGGSSGTGKELVANAIHVLSERANQKMVSVNCGAIPGDLLESELFGHEKGSFTGAISDRKGRFEVADKGTIFLDEIGDMPLILQVKLLRVLQNRVIERVGSAVSLPIDVRIITATHRNLEQSVNDGHFREDLFYRLNVIPIKIPSLFERREDIPLLIGHFLKRFVSADGRNDLEFDDEALEMLLYYDWPGNVRELENLIERLVILRGGNIIRARDLPPKILAGQNRKNDELENLVALPDDGIDLRKTLNDIENSLISQALKRTEGNKNQASKLLKMNRTTLIEKMKKRNFDFQSLTQ